MKLSNLLKNLNAEKPPRELWWIPCHAVGLSFGILLIWLLEEPVWHKLSFFSIAYYMWKQCLISLKVIDFFFGCCFVFVFVLFMCKYSSGGCCDTALGPLGKTLYWRNLGKVKSALLNLVLRVWEAQMLVSTCRWHKEFLLQHPVLACAPLWWVLWKTPVRRRFCLLQTVKGPTV